MRLYDCATAPSPRRVRIFLAEKNLAISLVPVDLANGEHLGDAFRQLNPRCTVPVLELDDGTCLSEATAICRYIEAAWPEPPLFGRSPTEQGVVAMWDHYCEQEGFFAAAEALRNSARGLAGRALTGPNGYEQIPALAARGRARVLRFLEALDSRLADAPYVAGKQFSAADITAMVAVDFAERLRLSIPGDQVATRRWLQRVRARPSASA